MSVCAGAILPLTQLGTPYATVCIFYDLLAGVGRFRSLMGSGALQQYTHLVNVMTYRNLL